MTKPIKIQYCDYINEMCCRDCLYAGEYKMMGPRLPPMPLSVCPDCGGALHKTIGRWMYTVIESPWWEIFNVDVTTYHGFERGRPTDPKNRPPKAP